MMSCTYRGGRGKGRGLGPGIDLGLRIGIEHRETPPGHS